jgi:transcriptional regulator with XRE-family HTH domain
MLEEHFLKGGVMANTTDKELGARIKALREQRHITQAGLGEALGLDQSAVSRIEDGARSLTAGELAAASSALGVTIDVLLEQEETVPALLRGGECDDEAVHESLRIFSECIDDYWGIEALSG